MYTILISDFPYYSSGMKQSNHSCIHTYMHTYIYTYSFKKCLLSGYFMSDILQWIKRWSSREGSLQNHPFFFCWSSFSFSLSLGNSSITTSFLPQMIQVHLLEGHRSEITESACWFNAHVPLSFTKEFLTFESTLQIRRFYI